MEREDNREGILNVRGGPFKPGISYGMNKKMETLMEGKAGLPDNTLRTREVGVDEDRKLEM